MWSGTRLAIASHSLDRGAPVQLVRQTLRHTCTPPIVGPRLAERAPTLGGYTIAHLLCII
ncbi:MAG: hypothetical protein ACYTX0_09355 [Nostoc sp.]